MRIKHNSSSVYHCSYEFQRITGSLSLTPGVRSTKTRTGLGSREPKQSVISSDSFT